MLGGASSLPALVSAPMSAFVSIISSISLGGSSCATSLSRITGLNATVVRVGGGGVGGGGGGGGGGWFADIRRWAKYGLDIHRLVLFKSARHGTQDIRERKEQRNQQQAD